jgi:cytochrome b561
MLQSPRCQLPQVDRQLRMQFKNTTEKYGPIAQLFHWTIVVLIIAQFVLAQRADDLPRGAALLATLALHKSIGITILGLAILRLVWRWMNAVPAIPPGTPRWQHAAAKISHAALYALLLLQPLFGWMMSSARNFRVSWFGLFTLPDLVSPNKQAYEFFHEVHEVLGTTLLVLAIVHAAAALKHHFIDRDEVLMRMLPWNRKGS